MMTTVAIFCLIFGAVILWVLIDGLTHREFPFRPRRSGRSPDGDLHKLHRDEEPIRFWIVVGLMSSIAIAMFATTIGILVGL